MDEKKPKLPAYMIFDNVDEYNKYEEGVHYEKNGLRGEKGKFVKPVNHILMTEEDIISDIQQKGIEKAKFAKDVAHAVLTNEEPKDLKLLDESENAEMIERPSDISSVY